MSNETITIDFRFNKKTGKHRLTIQYQSEPGTPLYLHNKRHNEILERVAETLKRQGLDIGNYEVEFEAREPIQSAPPGPKKTPLTGMDGEKVHS